jgi:hypothetical protein
MAPAGAVGCITDEVTGKAGEGFSPRVKNLNLIGPKVRRLRHQRSWSQNDLAIRLQLLGMDEGTRRPISIMLFVSDLLQPLPNYIPQILLNRPLHGTCS